MKKICILASVILIIVRNGNALERNQQPIISEGLYKRKTVSQEQTTVPQTTAENVAATVDQVSTADLKNMSIPSSGQTIASEVLKESSTLTNNKTTTPVSNEISTTDKSVSDPSVDCYQNDIEKILYDISIYSKRDIWTFDARTDMTIKLQRNCTTLTLPKNEIAINDISLFDNKNWIYLSNLTEKFVKSIPSDSYIIRVKSSGLMKVIPQGLIDDSDGNLTGVLVTAAPAPYSFKLMAVQMIFPSWNNLGGKADYRLDIQCYSMYGTPITNIHVTCSWLDFDVIKEYTKPMFADKLRSSMRELSFVMDDSDGTMFCTRNGIHYVFMLCYNSQTFYGVETMLQKMENLIDVKILSPSSDGLLNVVMLNKIDLSVGNLEIVRCGIIIVSHSESIMKKIILYYGIAIQWFNCLVTPMESSHKWLSTGLATHYARYAQSEAGESETTFVEWIDIVERTEAMIYNSDPIITSIMSRVENTNSIRDRTIQMILNYKAKSIIKMISEVIGKDKLHTAVKKYIENNRHRTTSSVDLINELKIVTRDLDALKHHGNKTLTIDEIINNWLSMKSLPFITVERNYTTGDLTITQSPLKIGNTLRAMLYNGTSTTESEKIHHYFCSTYSNDELSWIPINYYTSVDVAEQGIVTSQEVTHWLSPIQKSIVIPTTIRADQWIIVNNQQYGYYRVNYDAENWRKIIKELNSDGTSDSDETSDSYETLGSHIYFFFHEYARAQLIDDAFSFLEAGILDYETIFDLIEYLKNEEEFLPWIIAERHITRMFSTLLESPRHNFKEFMINKSQAISNSFGWHGHEPVFINSYDELVFPEEDNPLDGHHFNFPQLLTSLCRWGLPSCPAKMRQLYEDWFNRKKSGAFPKSYPTDESAQLSNLILCVGGDKDTATNNNAWNILQNEWKDNHLLLNIIVCWSDKTMVLEFFSNIFKSISSISTKTFFHIVNLFVVNNIESNVFPIFYHALKNNSENIKQASNSMKGPDSDLVLALVHVIVSIEDPNNPPFYRLRAFFKTNEARLETYFTRKDIREYLLRTEIHLDLSLPVFDRFRKP